MEIDQIKELTTKTYQLELELKKIELLVKERELANLKPARKKITLEQATIFVAIIGFAGSFLAGTLQGCFGQRQKQQEFEAALISRAVENGDSSISRRNLKFLLDAGLIQDRNEKIQRIVADSTYQLPNDPLNVVVQCRAYTTSGNRCKHMATDNTGYCFQHYRDDLLYYKNNGRKYHLSKCIAVNRSAMEITKDEALKMGLEPCKICKP